jgi:hypothetical protein
LLANGQLHMQGGKNEEINFITNLKLSPLSYFYMYEFNRCCLLLRYAAICQESFRFMCVELNVH